MKHNALSRQKLEDTDIGIAAVWNNVADYWKQNNNPPQI